MWKSPLTVHAGSGSTSISANKGQAKDSSTPFFKQEHFLFSLKRNESWKYNSNIILVLVVGLSMTPWNITEKQFQSANSIKIQQSICQANFWQRQWTLCLGRVLFALLETYRPALHGCRTLSYSSLVLFKLLYQTLWLLVLNMSKNMSNL